MRLLITTDTVGGVWRFAHELSVGLLEAGDSVALISFGRLPSPAQHAECALLASTWGEAFRYTPSDLPLEWMEHNDRCFEAGAAMIAKVAKQFAPELLHSNQFCFGALSLEIPKVLTAHSDVLSWARACRGGRLEESQWLARYRALVQDGLNGADIVTAPTGWMLRALGEGFELPSEIQVIPNGREIPSVPSSPRRVQAVTAGRLWDEAKDIAILDAVSSKMPLIIAGEMAGESASGGAYLPSFGRAKLVGWLAERELLQLFRKSAAYVCTSRYEPFGLAPLEAALCGCAVVARRIEPLNEVWGDAALYFNNAEVLSDLLTWLCEDRESLHKAQQQATARARRYTRGAMVASYRSVYSAVTEMARVP